MRVMVGLLATATLLSGAAFAGAAGPPAPPTTRLGEIIEQFSALRYHKALAYVMVDGSLSTCYMSTPLERAADASYTATLLTSSPPGEPGQPQKVHATDSFFRLVPDGERLSFSGGAGTGMDMELSGNGIVMRRKGALDGRMEMSEYFRRRDGSVGLVQHFKGKQEPLVYHEVAVPPELRDYAPAATVNAEDDTESFRFVPFGFR